MKSVREYLKLEIHGPSSSSSEYSENEILSDDAGYLPMWASKDMKGLRK